MGLIIETIVDSSTHHSHMVVQMPTQTCDQAVFHVDQPTENDDLTVMNSLMNSAVNSCDTTRNNHWSVSNKLQLDTENGPNVISTNVGDKENTNIKSTA